jgi:RNA polymerase sigma-70 factor (ECF subfamily)
VTIESLSDEELLRIRGDGARERFAAFYERYEGVVLGYFLRRVGSAELAADLAAETFAQALASRRRFRSDGPAAGWLFGIAHHVLARSARRGAVEHRARERMGVTPILLDDSTVAVIESLAADDAVERALALLPSDQRDAVRARVLDEATYDEIAARMSCSPAVARKRVSRGLAELRTHLEDPA